MNIPKTTKGKNVAITNDINNNDSLKKGKKKSLEIKFPTNKLSEKLIEGKKSIPQNKPIIIEIYAIFSLISLS